MAKAKAVKPVKPKAGVHVLHGGPTLADEVLEIEAAFGGSNKTDGLRARFGRKDSAPDADGNVQVTVYVEMVPAPDEVEGEYKSGAKGAKHTFEVFDPAKIAAHAVGERSSFTADSLEDAIDGLAAKVGGVK